MPSKSQRQVRSRRGATIVLVAVSSAALLAVGALAVDTGMMFKVRADGQRAADAAALAGAAEFLKTDAVSAIQPAVDNALEFAGRNYMGGRNIDVGGVQPMVSNGGVHTVVSNEATVDVIPSIFRVRVTVRRADSGLLWGNLFGVGSTAISTYAAAEAVDAGGAGCVMPFAIPDIWSEIGGDVNGNRIHDDGENWDYNPDEGDTYVPFDPNTPDPTQTGYGSDYRNGYVGDGITDDFGRILLLKPQTGNSDHNGNFYNLWNFVEDHGAKPIKERIEGCDPRVVNLGDDDSYYKKPGGTTGIKNQLQDRVAMDDQAYWDPSTGTVQGSSHDDWRNSERVVKIALYSPDQIEGLGGGGPQPITFNNIALFFLESSTGNDDITGRFLYYATGEPGGGTTGPLLKRIHLVE